MRKTASLLVVMVMAGVFLLIACSSAFAISASDRWYAGHSRSAGYGIKSDIRTPLSNPILVDHPLGLVNQSFVCSWIAADSLGPAGMRWVQTGWDITKLRGQPNQACRSYTEANDPEIDF